MFPNPASNCCLLRRGSFPLAGLIRVRIFCRYYSLVLNVGTLENPESCEVAAAVTAAVSVSVAAAVQVSLVVLLGLHMDLWCYMFLFAAFLNSQRGMTDAT